MIVQEEAVGGETDTVSPVVKIKGLRSNFHAHSWHIWLSRINEWTMQVFIEHMRSSKHHTYEQGDFLELDMQVSLAPSLVSPSVHSSYFWISILSASRSLLKASRRHCGGRHGGWHGGRHGGAYGGQHGGRQGGRQGGWQKENNKKSRPTRGRTWWPTRRIWCIKPEIMCIGLKLFDAKCTLVQVLACLLSFASLLNWSRPKKSDP